MIRMATAQDAAAICTLWNGMIRNTMSTFTNREKTVAEVTELLAARDGASFVAELHGRVVGFVTFGPFRSGPGYAATVEHSVVLDGDAQGQGVGRALMAAAENAALGMGHHVMVAGISGENPGAQTFHARLGFQEVGRMPEVGRKAGRWLDLILMQKILQ